MNLIIDASNVIHRTFWASQKVESFPDSNIHCLMFLRALKGYSDLTKPTTTYCAWDDTYKTSSGPNFRKQLIGEDVYKAGRDKDKTAAVFAQVGNIRELSSYLGAKNINPFNLEADDTISFLCNKMDNSADPQKVIVSSDEDLLQLVSDTTHIYTPTKKIVITPNNFKEVVGIEQENFLIHKCLVGDKSDNIKRVISNKKARDTNYIMSEEEKERFNINLRLISLNCSWKNEPGEESHLETEYANLQSNSSNAALFYNRCEELNLLSIIKNKPDWNKTFFDRQNMINIVNLLRETK